MDYLSINYSCEYRALTVISSSLLAASTPGETPPSQGFRGQCVVGQQCGLRGRSRGDSAVGDTKFQSVIS